MRILVIEDEGGTAEFLKVGLEAECFAVDIAEDGDVGSFLARTGDYDLVILDNMLPKKSGREVCEEIRDKGKSTPILMLSAKTEVIDKVDLLESGADDYLTKPFSFAELLARVRALLRRPAAVMRGDVLQLGSLALDMQKHMVRVDEKSIRLTRKEFMILEYLIRNAGMVLSRSMILDHVWDMHADPFSNTVESHIFSLRKKLGGSDGKKFIYTVPGRGYKLLVE